MSERLFRKAKKVVDAPKSVGETLNRVLASFVQESCPIPVGVECLVDFFTLRDYHTAAIHFLNEYEAYRAGDAVSFAPSPEVLEAFRKAVKGWSSQLLDCSSLPLSSLSG